MGRAWCLSLELVTTSLSEVTWMQVGGMGGTAVGMMGRWEAGAHPSRDIHQSTGRVGQLNAGGVCKPGAREIDAYNRQRESRKAPPPPRPVPSTGDKIDGRTEEAG